MLFKISNSSIQKLIEFSRSAPWFPVGFKPETQMQCFKGTQYTEQSSTLEAARVPHDLIPHELTGVRDLYVQRDQPGYVFPQHQDTRVPDECRRLWFSLTDPEPGHLLVFAHGPLSYRAGEVYTWPKDAWHAVANVGFTGRLTCICHQWFS